ncbi:substrate-binding domain-containing protein [Actinomadura roseirufa]|uniref:substrate-binding domain-containing protein n=1 Tax=Actinomadura roseirufa TaxID=2094049 RepID=UPI0013F17CD7|nr:substrate-binding domain-containing protein [Actinomadura roseirufa]
MTSTSTSPGDRSKRPWLSLAVSALLMAAFLGACDAAGSGAGAVYTALAPGKPAAAEHTKALDALPGSVRPNYDGFWNFARLGPNPYDKWKPGKAPWSFCYSSAYQGNPWRVAGLDQAQRLFGQLKAKGLAKGTLTSADANNSTMLQSTQISNMVQRNCDVILVMQPPSTGLCSAFQKAQRAGSLVVVMQTGTTCTNVIQSDIGEYAAAGTTARWLAQRAGRGDTVLLCRGIPGVTAAETRESAARRAFEAAGLRVDTINGDWTPSTVKAQTLRYLATHPGKVAGAWDSGNCATPMGQAFQQAHRPVPPIAAYDLTDSWLAFSRDAGDRPSTSLIHGPRSCVYEAFVVATRMLSGQKPRVNTLLYPIPVADTKDFPKYAAPGMTVNSAGTAEPTDGRPVADAYYDALFTGGSPAPALDPMTGQR